MSETNLPLEYRNAADDARDRRLRRRWALAVPLLLVATWLTWTGLRFLAYTLG